MPICPVDVVIEPARKVRRCTTTFDRDPATVQRYYGSLPLPWGCMAQRHSGLSLFEVLLVLAVLAVLMAIGLPRLLPSRADVIAKEVTSFLLEARFAAIAADRPVAVVWDAPGRRFLSLAADKASLGNSPCEEGILRRRLELGGHPGVTLGYPLPRGLVWLPSGQGRTCSGGGAFNSTITISGTRGAYRVIISRAGRIRKEKRR